MEVIDNREKELIRENPGTLFSKDVLDQIKWLRDVADFMRYADEAEKSVLMKRLNPREKETIKLFDSEYTQGWNEAVTATRATVEEP